MLLWVGKDLFMKAIYTVQPQVWIAGTETADRRSRVIEVHYKEEKRNSDWEDTYDDQSGAGGKAET